MKKYLYIGVGVVLIALLVILPRIFPVFDTKALLIEAVMVSQNLKSLNFYGKIVDQHGDPVPGVTVTARVGMNISFTQSGGYNVTTISDSSGLFKFTGIHGAGNGFTLQKDGYEFNQRLAVSSRPKDYVPDPNHPVIFPMWKLKGAEPMISTEIRTVIPCDGSPTSYNLLNGHKGSDLTVQLTRNPLNINRGNPFDWSITLSIPNGGLQENNDSYPYEAPADGYQPSITINMPVKSTNWSDSLNRSYYFKNRNGQNYGRLAINIQADFQPPPTYFDANIYANPSGSRNLEFDPAKQINP